MDLTFISLLRVSKSRAAVFGSSSRSARIQYASPRSAAIEHRCSIGAKHAQNCQLASSDLTIAHRDRTIQDSSSTFQQELCASFS
jgi:hypothetical protein